MFLPLLSLLLGISCPLKDPSLSVPTDASLPSLLLEKKLTSVWLWAVAHLPSWWELPYNTFLPSWVKPSLKKPSSLLLDTSDKFGEFSLSISLSISSPCSFFFLVFRTSIHNKQFGLALQVTEALLSFPLLPFPFFWQVKKVLIFTFHPSPLCCCWAQPVHFLKMAAWETFFYCSLIFLSLWFFFLCVPLRNVFSFVP